MSRPITDSCPLGGQSKSRCIWTFEPLDSPAGGYLDVLISRREPNGDRIIACRRIKHYSLARRRDMRRAALGAAATELRQLARWATARADAIEAGGRTS